MNIGLFTSVYFNNIGNGFIDVGAEETIKSAKPQNAEVIKVSQCANFAASLGYAFLLKENRFVNKVWELTMKRFSRSLHDKTYKSVNNNNVFSIADMSIFDYFIIPGCVLTVPFFSIYGALLEKKVEQGAKLIFLGASGNYYTDYEIEYVSKWLKKLNPYALMFRDSIAFKAYGAFSSNVYNGIDNVFFVNRIGLPRIQTEKTPYVVFNFEKSENDSIQKELECSIKDRNIIYSNHKPFPYSKIIRLVKQNIMISDDPMDYLFLYRHVSETFSDRVHACIPTLSFGNAARLYSDSPRVALFENVGLQNITKELVRIEDLDSMQEKQISFLRDLLK